MQTTNNIQKHTHMKNEKYNGWTNYATWMVSLEIIDFCPYDSDGAVTPEGCQSYAEDVVSEGAEGLALAYAEAFLREVNWSEIAEAINERLILNA
jgi:hypothetical protein